jgi:peroxiredoxin
VKQKHWLALAVFLGVVVGVELYVFRGGPSAEESSVAPNFDPMTYFPHLEPGEIAPAFEGEYVGGGKESIGYPEGGGKTLLFVLSPSCGTCAKTIPKWSQLAAQLEPPARVFGLVIGSYQGEQRLMKDKSITFPLLRFPNRSVVEQYKISKVPQTILVAPGGRVEAAILGELNGSQVKDLLHRLAGRPEKPSI